MTSSSQTKLQAFAVRGAGKVYCSACHECSSITQEDIDKGCYGFQCQSCWHWNMIKIQPQDAMIQAGVLRSMNIE